MFSNAITAKRRGEFSYITGNMKKQLLTWGRYQQLSCDMRTWVFLHIFLLRKWFTHVKLDYEGYKAGTWATPALHLLLVDHLRNPGTCGSVSTTCKATSGSLIFFLTFYMAWRVITSQIQDLLSSAVHCLGSYELTASFLILFVFSRLCLKYTK